MLYMLKDKMEIELSQIGGKALSLMKLSHEDFNIPDGFVLSVRFFEPWLSEIKRLPLWDDTLNNLTKENCDKLKERAIQFKFNDDQKVLFYKALDSFNGELFAVRSSSPEEDLEGNSFAGMYDSVLGVNREKIEKTAAEVFASCFDYRVMSYKKQKNIPLDNTSIAIIVQVQLDAKTSGVAFSLNPLNNCFDEVLINANFGLGESVVSGKVTPDTYVVDSFKRKIIQRNILQKTFAVWLDKDGGTVSKRELSNDRTLNDSEMLQIAELTKKVEQFYDKPIDIEWAYADGNLYLLQARPITTHFPFFKELLTKPGENKRFYIDLIGLTQGFNKPMSVLGLEIWSNMIYDMKMHMMSPDINGSTPAIHGKQYLSVTAFQKLVGKKGALKFLNDYDSNIKKIFDKIDLEKHKFVGKVAGTDDFKWMMFKSILKMIPATFSGIFGNYKKGVKNYNKRAKEIIEETRNLKMDKDFTQLSKSASYLMEKAMGTAPILFGGVISQYKLNKMFKGSLVEKYVSHMNINLDGNPTSEMGLLLYELAKTETFKKITSREEFKSLAEKRAFDVDFLNIYDEFMRKFSARGFGEIDVASKRMTEDVGMLYDKLIEVSTDENHILSAEHKRKVAYEELLQYAKSMGKEKKFRKTVDRMKATLGYREHPKYMLVLIMAKLHDICLEIARDFVKDKRLDKAYDIFDLKVADIEKALHDKSFDMRKAREENISGYIQVKEWPLVIDSRGKIYKADLKVEAGDYIGTPIASGKVRGRAKIMLEPYEKELKNGEILVAKFTEPSWTPIFTNAKGVVLEIGGPLQHGGIIAREYGIPCVSGLMGIMDILSDGDLIEVDGDNGVVRIIEKK